jgi:hypothetical protein
MIMTLPNNSFSQPSQTRPWTRRQPDLFAGLGDIRLLPGNPMSADPFRRVDCPAVTLYCRIVQRLTVELAMMALPPGEHGMDRRRAASHIQQIAMYTCHVVLRIPMAEVGRAFGRHRTTVSHACQVVEDRRENKGYEQFVTMIERLVLSVFSPMEGDADA